MESASPFVGFFIGLGLITLVFLTGVFVFRYANKYQGNQGTKINPNQISTLLNDQLNGDREKNFSTWSIVEDLINDYHRQALSQAAIQFWFSIVAAMIGFIFIISVALFPEQTPSEKIITTMPATIIEIVSVLFIKQAESTRKRATNLYQTLRQDYLTKTSIDLIESIEDIKFRALLMARLALKISNIEIPLEELHIFLAKK